MSSSWSPLRHPGLPLGAPWAPSSNTWPSLIASWVLSGRPWRPKRVQEALWIDFRPIVDPLGLILAAFLDPHRANSPHRGRHQRCDCLLRFLSCILKITLNNAETIVSSAGTSEQQKRTVALNSCGAALNSSETSQDSSNQLSLQFYFSPEPDSQQHGTIQLR